MSRWDIGLAVSRWLAIVYVSQWLPRGVAAAAFLGELIGT